MLQTPLRKKDICGNDNAVRASALRNIIVCDIRPRIDHDELNVRRGRHAHKPVGDNKHFYAVAQPNSVGFILHRTSIGIYKNRTRHPTVCTQNRPGREPVK